MKDPRKELKVSSFVVLLFVVLDLVEVVAEAIWGGVDASVSGDVSDAVMMAMKIVLVVLSLILLVPQTYVGIKGLKIAKNPAPGKAHIVWAAILLVISAFGALSAGIDLVKAESVTENVSALLSNALEALIFFDYVRSANAVAKEI